jgi:prephenate dehydratase
MNQKQTNHIAFMGIAGANADLACRNAEPYMETLPCSSFEGVFEAVKEGKADLGMLPMENSHAGRVSEIHHLLPKMGLHVVGEYFLPIKHVLAGTQDASSETVKEVYSHPQALMQCYENLKSRKLESLAASNTAIAAKQVAEQGDNSKAALCSPLAAELNGLKILEENMQDKDDNVTVFIKVAREILDEEVLEESPLILTSLLFECRNIPSALYKGLGGFATNGVNLLKLESYIAGGKSPTAEFLVTFEGKPEDKAVQLALEELGFFSKRIELLGIYPAAEERSGQSKLSL